MKKVFSIAAGLLCCVGIAQAEEPAKAWSVDTSVGLYSDYMFRGFDLYRGAAIQPSAGVNYDTGYGKLTGSLWMHISGDGDTADATAFTEIDETLSYSYDFKPVTFKVGNVWYTYPDGTDEIKDTPEVFTSVVLDDSEYNPWFTLSPSFSFYHDWREFHAQYYELGLSHQCTPEEWLGKGFNATPFVAFGFASNAEKVYDKESGLVQITYGISSTIPFGDLSLVPSVNYTHGTDKLTVDRFWFGGSLNYSF